MQLTFTTIRRFFTLTTLISALFVPQADAFSFCAAKPVIVRKKTCTCTYGQLGKGLLRLAYRKKGKIAGAALVAGAAYFAWQYWNKPETPAPTPQPTSTPSDAGTKKTNKKDALKQRMGGVAKGTKDGQRRDTLFDRNAKALVEASPSKSANPATDESDSDGEVEPTENKEQHELLTEEQKQAQAKAKAALAAILNTPGKKAPAKQ